MANRIEKVLYQEINDRGGPFVFSGTLDEMIAGLQAIRDVVPAEYRAAARGTIYNTVDKDDYHYVTFEAFYIRPETAEETVLRQDKAIEALRNKVVDLNVRLKRAESA